MTTLIVVLICLGIVALAVLITAYICFRMAFYIKRDKRIPEKHPLPKGGAYEPFHDIIKGWHLAAEECEYTQVSITSFDGLKLYAKLYKRFENAPVEIMFHGYRSIAEKDLIGNVFRCFGQGKNVLLVSQRGSGKSGGRVTTFGIKEHRDCLAWVDYIIRMDKNAKIILTGVSMGAATVLMAAGRDLPDNVVGIIADCGYSTPKAIIKTVISRDMHLPPNICYPFVKLGGLLFGGFNIDAYSPLEAMKECKVPVLFFHGKADAFVPCEMTVENYNACIRKKRMELYDNADHGLCFAINPDEYMEAVYEFFEPVIEEKY